MISGCFQTISGFTYGVCFPLKRQRSTGSCVNSAEVYSTEVFGRLASLSAFYSSAHSLCKVSPKLEKDKLFCTSLTKCILRKNETWESSYCQMTLSHHFKTLINILLSPQKFIGLMRVSLEKSPYENWLFLLFY